MHFALPCIGQQWMKAKMMGALGMQSSLDKEDGGKKKEAGKKGKDDKKGKGKKQKGWGKVRQASQESKGTQLSREEAAIIIQACKILSEAFRSLQCH